MDKKIRIGHITKPHGLKGEFKIYPYTSDTDSFNDYKVIFVDGKNEKYSFEYMKSSKNMLIAKFKEINNIDELVPILDKSIFIDYSEKRSMEKDEYLISELIGLEVYEKDKLIGTVSDVLTYAANDVFRVIKDGNERLIPNVKQFVKNIDIQAKKITVELIEGM